MFTHEGESVLDLFKQLRGKMQFNTSLSIFLGDAVYKIEPYSATLNDRLEAVRLCQENGIMANSALVQPILFNVLTDELLDEFFARIRKYGIINIKPEFLTACIENMVLMAQLLESEATTDSSILKEIFESYFQDDNLNHVKQRGRTAPARKLSKYWIDKIITIAKSYGVSVSICYWVREQLGITSEDLPIINENGFKCLGYQLNLFTGV
jgi:DNA repair photolyase